MTRNNQTATLVKLRDARMTVTDPAQDVRGRKVVDKSGDDVGQVEELLIDEQEEKVRFLRVASGGFLGMGATKFLIPVDAITGTTRDAVQINQSREHVAGAPGYDPELSDEPYYERLYGYYGFGPYWGPGYVYPVYPKIKM